MHRNILIISDIEGSSGCGSYAASSFMTEEWPEACAGMSLDVNAVAQALFNAGARNVLIKDFHRTAYNLLPELIDSRAKIISGYKGGPVPGIGDPGDATALLMLGMHAPSGSSGFLAHTLTSRLAKISINGKLTGEAELFSASLAPYRVAPVFFSGCPVACSYAEKAIQGISTFPAIKDSSGLFVGDIKKWRDKLAGEAVKSLWNKNGAFTMEGPFAAEVTMRDGDLIAEKIAARWKMEYYKDTICFTSPDFNSLYQTLIRICYLTPLVEKILPAGLAIYDLLGRFGQHRVRRQLKKIGILT